MASAECLFCICASEVGDMTGSHRCPKAKEGEVISAVSFEWHDFNSRGCSHE